MGTTKVKIGILAYKNISVSTITDLLPLQEQHHSFAWNQDQELIWYIKISKWMNDQFDKLVEEIHNIVQEQPLEQATYKAISVESSTDIIGHPLGAITYRTPTDKVLKKNIDLYQPADLPHNWAALLDYMTLDHPIALGKNHLSLELNQLPIANNNLLLCYFGEEENQLTAAITKREDKRAYPSSQEPAAIETLQCTNGYPYLFCQVKSLEEWQEMLEEYPLSDENRLLIFEYDHQEMTLFPCLLDDSIYYFRGSNLFH